MLGTFQINCMYAATDFVNIRKPIVVSRSYFFDADLGIKTLKYSGIKIEEPVKGEIKYF
jgi:hypothetical protein